MKNLFLFLAILPFLSHGQDSIRTVEATRVPMPLEERGPTDSSTTAINYLEKSVWRVEFFGPGVINESRIGRQTSLVSHLRTVGAFVFQSSTNPTERYSAYTINPQFSIAIRQFYNFARRVEAGKSIRYNSGNYVTARLAYIFPPIIDHNLSRIYVRDIQGATLQAMWGFQRTYRRNFYLNLEVGLGLGSYYTNPVSIASYFTLGYTFPNHHERK